MGLQLIGDDWLLLSILFFIVVVLSTVYYARAIKQARALDPISIFLFFYCLFVLPLPIRAYMTKEIAGDVTDHLPELLPYLPWAVFLSAIGIPFFVCGYYSKLSIRLARRIPTPRTARHPRAAFAALAILSLFLLAILARDAGGLLNFILLGYGSTAEMFGKGYLAIGFAWLVIAVLFLLYSYGSRKKKADLIFFVVSALLLGVVQIILGARSSLMYMGLVILLFWHTAIRPVSIRALGIFGIICFFGLNILGMVRASKYGSLADVWERTSASLGESESGNSLIYTLTTGEFVVPFETLPQMMRSVGRDLDPRFGLTYIEAPLFLIPSVLFPNRPSALTHWYMDRFYGVGYGLNEGRAFFFTAEGYLNFGPLGVPFVMLMWGWFLGATQQYRVLARGEPSALLLYALTVAFIFRGIAGDSVSMVAGLPEQSLGAAILGIWISNRLGLGTAAWKADTASSFQSSGFPASR